MSDDDEPDDGWTNDQLDVALAERDALRKRWPSSRRRRAAPRTSVVVLPRVRVARHPMPVLGRLVICLPTAYLRGHVDFSICDIDGGPYRY